jgi:hypothetical protein
MRAQSSGVPGSTGRHDRPPRELPPDQPPLKLRRSAALAKAEATQVLPGTRSFRLFQPEGLTDDTDSAVTRH